MSNGSLPNYVTTSALSNYSTISQTNNLISSSIVSNQNILSINFLTFVNASDFSSNVYNYNNLFQAVMVDVGAANSGLGTFIQVSSSNFTNGQSFYAQTFGSRTTYYIDIRDSGNLSIVFNSLGAFSNIGCPCNPNTTYKITYYNPSSNCPWYNSSSTSSCYMMQALTSNSVPLNSNISVYAISTRNTSLTAYLTVPSLSFGSNFYIKDFFKLNEYVTDSIAM